MAIEQWLLDNYSKIAADRGVSLDVIADGLEAQSPRLAAELRAVQEERDLLASARAAQQGKKETTSATPAASTATDK